MMNKKIAIIIGLQALIIIVLFWMLVFYGKDEYDDFRTENEEEIESLDRVSEKEGVSIVSLSPALRRNSGISTAKVDAVLYKGKIKSFGNVVSIDGLIEAKAQYLSLVTEVANAEASHKQNLLQHQRLKALNADDKNVSDRAVQEALALVNMDKAKISNNELQIKNLLTSIKLQWGEALAKIVLNNQLPPHLANLLSRKNVLVQISLPLSASSPKPGNTVDITPLNEPTAPIKAVYVSPSAQIDSNGIGKTFYYSAPAEQLRIGMRVNVLAETNASYASSGVIIPNDAVVWYAGTPWAYFKQGKDQFVRRPISADTEVDTGWFNQDLSAESEVVVSGAQLLLSEEFKYLIKNENED